MAKLNHLDTKCSFLKVSVRKLILNGTQMWDYQRTLNMDRVMDLMTSFKNNYKEFGSVCIRQAIIICKYNNIDYIVDGQHRYIALYNLIKDNFINDIYILVTYIICQSENDIRFEFKNINDIVVVPKCFINPSEIIDKAINTLMSRYTNLKKSSKRTNRPNVNIDTIKSSLIEKDIIHKLNIISSEHLVELLERLDAMYSVKDSSYFAKMFKISVNDSTLANILIRIREKRLHHLGLFKSELSFLWIQDLLSMN
jgi:hypothetical protein